MGRFFKQYWIPLIGAFVAILAAWSPFLLWPSNIPSINWARAQVVLSAIAFPTIFATLYLTMVRLRKSMAKPKIKVAFNEKGEQETNLTYTDNNPHGLPPLWIINEGNEISRFFQIDVIIQKNIVNDRGKNLLSDIEHITLKEFGNDYIFSYTNEAKYTLFINKPYNDQDFILNFALDYKKCIEEFKNDFRLKYKIYGDWAESQEGILRVNIVNKEAPHAIS